MKLSVFIACSLDGYIAGPDGDLSWLPTSNREEPGEDYGYSSFFASVDAILMGRNTFDTVTGFESWPYADKPVHILTRRPLEVPDAFHDARISPLSGSPAEVLKMLSEERYQHIYIDGGETIRQFLNEKLINQFTITIIPVLLGEGIPLFSPPAIHTRLELTNTSTHDGGIVQLTYKFR
jgi:dihydrofolate reductase